MWLWVALNWKILCVFTWEGKRMCKSLPSGESLRGAGWGSLSIFPRHLTLARAIGKLPASWHPPGPQGPPSQSSPDLSHPLLRQVTHDQILTVGGPLGSWHAATGPSGHPPAQVSDRDFFAGPGVFRWYFWNLSKQYLPGSRGGKYSGLFTGPGTWAHPLSFIPRLTIMFLSKADA